MRKKFLPILFSGLMILSLSACGSGGQSTEELENQIAALQSQLEEMNNNEKPEIAETGETNAVTTSAETTTTTTATEPEPVEIVYSPETDFEYEFDGELGGVKITKYIGNDPIVNIPPTIMGYGVVGLGEDSFRDLTFINIVSIPEGVKEVGIRSTFGSPGVFEGCSELFHVSFPESLTFLNVRVFEECEKLASVTIPGSNVELYNESYFEYDTNILKNENNYEDGCFYLGGNLLRVKDYVQGAFEIKPGTKAVCDLAFAFCRDITSIIIPDSVTTIGDLAFSYCASLTRVTIPNSVTTIGDGAFEHCGSVKSITIPDSVTTIGDKAFEYCRSLNSITIPDSVTRIKRWAFQGCTSLTSITISDSVTEIGEDAFSGCTSLTSITIPDSVTEIGTGAFSDCTSLTSITIPDNVSINGKAFSGCKNITKINASPSIKERVRETIED